MAGYVLMSLSAGLRDWEIKLHQSEQIRAIDDYRAGQSRRRSVPALVPERPICAYQGKAKLRLQEAAA